MRFGGKRHAHHMMASGGSDWMGELSRRVGSEMHA
jgi:hypothetical protein